MEEDFNHTLTAIWLVFGGSYLNHSNAPMVQPDYREQLLVDLLCSYLKGELASSSTKQVYDSFTLTQLASVCNLLQLWSRDLDLIYEIRGDKNNDLLVRQLAQRYFIRIKTLKNCTIIPNGLISAEHTGHGHSENVCLAVVKEQGGLINWIQVNPGNAYHQHYQHIASEKSNAYLEITGISPDSITEEWLYLLGALKAVRPGGSNYYDDMSLYECLLSHLNGKTVFQSEPDEGFIVSSLTSPVHMWQVVDQSFRCLLRHFLGKTYHVVYQHLLTNFKLFLMRKTLAAYKGKICKCLQECNFLLQEMCGDVAQQALYQGNEEQKASSTQLIKAVKAAIEQHYCKQEQKICRASQINDAHVLSLSFVAPRLFDYTLSSKGVESIPGRQVHPVFVKPTAEDDIIDYLQQLQTNFIKKLIDATDMYGIALLSYGIEQFLIDYLANTNILEKKIGSPFSRNDIYLAKILLELAGIYCGCQTKFVKDFLWNVTYEPQFFAKNVTIQFFVYAAIAALNFRDSKIGPLLASHNLCVSISDKITLNDTIPHLVINDSRWQKVLLAVKTFFKPKIGEVTLFSFLSFKFSVKNDANTYDTNIEFAYQLLKKYPSTERCFNDKFHDLKEELFSQKWAELAYTDTYVPALYFALSKIANFAKISLTGFLNMSKILKERNCAETVWVISHQPHRYCSVVSFKVNRFLACDRKNTDQLKLSSYIVNSSSYQRFLTCTSENEIIATQEKKPETMGCIRYMQLGFVLSKPYIKLERLYIALKEKQLDYSCKEEGVLIKQALFEISQLMYIKQKTCSLLEWTCHYNQTLIHKFGLLCIENAWAMQYRLTQHHAIGDIILVALGLLTFYPTAYKDTFVEGIMDVYRMLKDILAHPPVHLSDVTLMHLDAYLLIAVQAKPQVLETDMLTVLQALIAIQTFKVKGSSLNNSWSLQVHIASFTWCPWVERQLEEDPTLLNDLMLSVIPQWDQSSRWQKSQAGLLFTCNGYAIRPLLGCIYFQNQPIMGLPSTITEHRSFKEYLGETNFPVIPSSHETDTQEEVPCYLSIDRTPQLRLTLIKNALLIEEWIENDFHRYIPARELLGHSDYSRLFYEAPHNKEKLLHWLDKDKNIIITDAQRRIIFKLYLNNNYLLSLEHKGYVVPWNQLQDSYFKNWLECIESCDWIELIAKPSVSSGIHIESLNFPRLGLNFELKEGKFFSKQIHSYFIAEQQHFNTLHGFSSYLVLKKKEQNSLQGHVKVVIPHRKVTPKKGPFYVLKTTVNRSEIKSPAYFIYDYDPKMGLLKGHHIRALLYLALLYFRSASLDDHDLSRVNPYHIARENLELCWKDQPYDNVELDIIEQLLDVSAMRCLHSHLIALYLKVVSLLSSSLRLAFLFTDKTAQQNIKRSVQLLKSCARQPSEQTAEQSIDLLSIYLQNKSTIFARIRLNPEEEQDAVKHCSVSFLSNPNKCYNIHYREFFSQQALITTAFLHIFKEHLSVFSFTYGTNELNFSSGINGILTDRFQLTHFFTLYKLAKASSIALAEYRYLLHHLLIRATISSRFPADLANMLARALLLVAENPALFPNSDSFFNENMSVNLSERQLFKAKVLDKFPAFGWEWQSHLDPEENEKAKEKARWKDEKENKLIWSLLSEHDLDVQGVPHFLPENPSSFKLRYERYINFSNERKRNIVRKYYLQAAYNDSLYQFFVHVLLECDELKYASEMGWTVAPFIHKTIAVTLKPNEEQILPIPEPVSLVKWATPQQPLIDLNDFFVVNSQAAENGDFLFESQLREPKTGYQQKFYSELKDSWSAYTNEPKCSYSWLSTQSKNELKSVLQTKYDEFHDQAEQIWDEIETLFKQRSNSESNDYFALRWYSGQVRHYHKRDILRLLIEPHKLTNYNPDCINRGDFIIQELLQYVIHEINSAKIVRVLALIEQYKHAQKEPERFSLLQSLVRSLQENIDPESYHYPHWFLFQFENEIIVRDNQRELIVAMLSQTEKAMYQLNMGEGKSSVILPLLSYNLANGKQLLRINVLPALLTTMEEFLRQRFSGLIRKQVYSLPFNRDTDISTEHLRLIFETLQTCQQFQHILLITPEHRMCLQLKIRELMLENQQQIGATDIFNWETYRQRAEGKTEIYQDLNEEETEKLFMEQDERLRACLRKLQYIDANNRILKVPPRQQGYKTFAQFVINDSNFRELSSLKAAYRELLYNSTLAYKDSRKKLELLHEIGAVTAIDLLDESDEILKHGTELNYTMGDKHVFAGGELRWQIPQFFIKAIFCDSDVRDVITAGKADGFTMINLHFSSQGGVPFIQFLNESFYTKKIKPLLINKFFLENLRSIRKYQCSVDNPLIEGETSSLRKYVAGELPLSTEKKVMEVLASKGPLKDKVLIAKGWLSHGILFHVLSAKYRVQYGLNLYVPDQTPKLIAIPFFGKDTPSPRSEFSHPDVMLGFTIVSYLYQGLDQAQLKKTVNKLKNKFCHQVADTHLRTWTEAGRAWIERQTDEFPPLLLTSLQHLDLADEQCLKQVHQYLSGNYKAIFFYLNQFVLLEEAMQYLSKISANAHSLVGYDAALGFSGTDDRKITMPFQIKSLRSVTQEGTNGKLLSVLTQKRNSDYYSLKSEDTISLLKQLCSYVKDQPQCHALIDAGALITGLTNYAVAEFLLAYLPSNFLGILYFSDEGNSLTVLTRDKKNLALQDCYLDKSFLFAYLDDIHTRGTDIKLPLNCHAILTIGMGMEKDKLMQAAMRLRQLAEKQSISLWGTQAVTLAIARDNSVDVASINSREVIKWITQNTIDNINADLFHVAVRKINFQFLKKAEAWLKEAPTTMNSLIQCCQEKEMFRLEDFYALSPRYEDLGDRLHWFVSTRFRTFWQELEQELQSKRSNTTVFHEKVFNKSEKVAFRKLLSIIFEELESYLQSGYVHDSLDNDEEKEVEVEVIQEQKVVSKVKEAVARAEKYWNPNEILQDNFIKWAKEQNIIMPLNRIKNLIQAPDNLKNIIWHRDIYMTANYIHSVVLASNERLDNYLRPVDVVLMHRSSDKSTAVLLSGFEASSIKVICYEKLGFNLLIHINDIDGPTQLPVNSLVSKQEQKLLTIIKLFSGECYYSSLREVQRLSKRVGRIYPQYFACLGQGVSFEFCEKLFGVLYDEGFLDFAGVMTEKLLMVLLRVKSEESLSLNLPGEYQSYNQLLLEKLYRIFLKLIFSTSSLKSNHDILRQWVGTRGRLTEYSGSELESILNSEYELKCSQ